MLSLLSRVIRTLIRFYLYCIMGLFAILFWPVVLAAVIYYYAFSPIQVQKSKPRSIPFGNNQPDGGKPQRSTLSVDELITSYATGVTTLPQLLKRSVQHYGNLPALGERKTLRVDDKIVTVMVDGKHVQKTHKIPSLGPYTFKTYSEVYREVLALGHGLESLGVKRSERLAIYCKTRPEWQISAQACFAWGYPVVTVYPSLGADALTFSLKQTETTLVITETSTLDNVLKASANLPSLKSIVYIGALDTTKTESYAKQYGHLQLVSYDALLEKGKAGENKEPEYQPKPDSLAVIMYTSGTTGNPKGIMISHANIVAGASGVRRCAPEPLNSGDTYIAFLPLAHILELLAETTILSVGGSLGYSNPLTLRDEQVNDENGNPCGDLTALKPTIMASVPLILDRLRTAIEEQTSKSPVTKFIFQAAYHLKRRNFLQGLPSPILDKLLFSKIAGKFGGRLRYMLSGGAPLSQDTQEFITLCFCCPVWQGYGLSETTGCGTIASPYDREFGHVGGPNPSCEIKLVDVPEMGYKSTDLPYPRGEIAIRGPNITMGYFQEPEKTASEFRDGPDGEGKWFFTGDIGCWTDVGNLKIIDRKKDLVKLSHGEYIALGSLESSYCHSPLIDNVCIYASSLHGRPVALVVPNQKHLETVASKLGVSNADMKTMCADPKLEKAVLQEMEQTAATSKMQKWEIPAAVKLYADPWTPDNGMLTDAMKLKRHEINKKFAADIEKMIKTIA